MDLTITKNDLNFRVYAAAAMPTTGQENDLVIITGNPVTNWIMSPDAPAGTPKTDGDVWIQYSVTGETFNALRQNAFALVPVKAFQYEGAWVEKEAAIYQNGVFRRWFVWNGELYNAGNEFTEITGGWGISYGIGTLTKGTSMSFNASAQAAISVANDLNTKYGEYARINIAVKGFTKNYTSGFVAFVFHSDKQYGTGSNYHMEKIAENITKETTISFDIPTDAPKHFSIVVYNGAVTIEKIWIE